ncbi:MAG: symmetrical bis(5'-nucleosyl)-tetraphosphatase [Gammaproteobacteria bacterium]|nr:symmetrical bis(5'-nucleosyl)-tetraphosphatase [Gammaproteobacteria bacterium]
MAIYAIGDVQGCYKELRQLLQNVSFDPSSDVLWLTGDLVNRGPSNLETLRFVKELGNRAVAVLGNHDLYLLAVVFSGRAIDSGDTFGDVLRSKYCEELCDWLRERPLIHGYGDYILVHAGIPHIWDLTHAISLASEVEQALRGSDYVHFLREMFGNQPSLWSDELEGIDRLRCVTNYLTRMRFVRPNGELSFESNLGLEHTPHGSQAWFRYEPRFTESVVFGHWASLNGTTHSPQFIATDTGCVWGRTLTAVRLSDRQTYAVAGSNELQI